jgi:hypothetical protein
MSPCEKYKCWHVNDCPNIFTRYLIESISGTDDMELNKVCQDYMTDPTEDDEFVITIWGI